MRPTGVAQVWGCVGAGGTRDKGAWHDLWQIIPHHNEDLHQSREVLSSIAPPGGLRIVNGHVLPVSCCRSVIDNYLQFINDGGVMMLMASTRWQGRGERHRACYVRSGHE